MSSGASPEFAARLQQLADADQIATEREWNRYFDRLISFARTNLKGIPRRAADEEDVALSAMNSFFMGVQEGRFRPQDRDELWRLLATITVRKATKELRKHYAQKRGGGQVRGESVFENRHASGDENCGINNVLDDRLIPELSDRLGMNCRELLDGLQDQTLRQTAVLRLEGLTIEEIAGRLDCSPATVKRKLERIRKAWNQSENAAE